MKMRYLTFFGMLGLFFLLTVRGHAQNERYEAGLHLVQFEKTWEKYRADPAAKKRALKQLLPVVPNFFAARWGEAARLLDQARHALKSKQETPKAVQWAESLTVKADIRLLDKSANLLTVTLDQFYPLIPKTHPNAEVVLQFLNQGKALLPAEKFPINKLPLEIKLPVKGLPEGDLLLQIKILVGGKVLDTDEQMISIVANLRPRLNALSKGLAELVLKEKSTDYETAHFLFGLVENLANGVTFETNYPAAQLLREAEAILKSLKSGKSYFGPDRKGDFWLRLPTSMGKFVSRLFVPEEVTKGKPLPLVVALHGAGGSENLFFEAYGNGLIVQMCKERGWLLVAPRSGYLIFNMPVEAIVTEVAKLYPVDKSKVFVVGHSMGAAQAIGAAQENPGLFAGVAALGGSGKVNSTEKLKNVPIFVGVGDSDLALEMARRLHKFLKNGGVKQLQYREYPDVEHIMIVREALPEVFAFFDKALKK